MTRRRQQVIAIAATALFGAWAWPASAQQQQQRQDQNRNQGAQPRPAAPIPNDPRVPLPGDPRVPLPRDPRAPIGSTRLPDFPSAAQRSRAMPVDPPREPRHDKRPGQSPQSLQEAIEHAQQLDADARRRYGVPSGPVRGNPWGGGGGYGQRYYRDYWRGGYGYGYGGPYYGGPYQQQWVEEPIPADVGPVDAGPRNARNAGADQALGNNAGPADATNRLPDLPPDEMLGDEEMSAALRQALANSPEWKQATADVVRAWAIYADAVDAVLTDLQDKPEYRKAKAELRRATARLQAAQSAEPAGAGPTDELVAATDAALAARRMVRRLESAAVGGDGEVKRAERRLDNGVKRRDQIREKVAANLPENDRQPATPNRPKLLEEE